MNNKLKIFFSLLSIGLFATFCFSWEQHEQQAAMDTVASLNSNEQAKPSLNKDVLQKLELQNKSASEAAADEMEDILTTGIVENSDAKLEPRKAAKRAIQLIREAAERNDKSILKQITKAGKDCYSCDPLYKEAKKIFNDSDSDPALRRFMAEVLARSENAAYQQLVADRMNQALKNPQEGDSPNTYSSALAEAPLDPTVVDSVTTNLESENPYVRDMALSVLTRDGTLQSAQKLYEYTLEKGNPDGFYSENMGLGRMRPEPDAFAYLEGLARQRDEYSHLAIKSLLNAGTEGLKSVVSILSESSGGATDMGLLTYAVNHIDRDPATIAYLQTLSVSQNSAVRQLANAVIKEKKIRADEMKKEIEYNENFEKGIISVPPQG